MKKILLLNLSPRGRVSTSLKYLNIIKELIEKENSSHQIKSYSYALVMNDELRCDELFSFINSCDEIILSSPLYVDSLPATGQHFIESYYKFFQKNKTDKSHNLYTIINCGFPESHQNKVALKIIRNFSKKVNCICQYNLGIGMGAYLADKPIDSKLNEDLFNHLKLIVKNINDSEYSYDNTKDFYIYTSFGLFDRWKKDIYMFFGNSNFKYMAKKNNAKQLLYNKPYDKY